MLVICCAGKCYRMPDNVSSVLPAVLYRRPSFYFFQVVLHASASDGGGESRDRIAALGQGLSAARDAEVSVMHSLQSELRRSAYSMQVHIVSAPLVVHSAMADLPDA